MTGSQQNTTCGLFHADHVAGGGRAQKSILTNDQLLHAVRSADLRDLLNNLGVEVAAITTNDQEGALCTLGDGEEDTSDEGLGVVGLLEDGDLLAKTRAEDSQQRCIVSPMKQSQHSRSGLLVGKGGDGDGLDGHCCYGGSWTG